MIRRSGRGSETHSGQLVAQLAPDGHAIATGFQLNEQMNSVRSAMETRTSDAVGFHYLRLATVRSGAFTSHSDLGQP